MHAPDVPIAMTDPCAANLEPLPAELLLNPAVRRDQAYGAQRAAVLGQAALAEARADITRWPGYA
ncbi:MAG TPA: hypothetical protein PLB22_10075, partial [Ottowia sp.]|nr:hypothetical protein [Ottowia sp.]